MKPEHRAPSSSEFSRVVRADAVRAGRETVERIEADDGERAALARRLGLIELPRLVAVVRLSRRGESISVEGEFDADVVQACVATLVPVPSRVAEGFSVRLTPEGDPGEVRPGALLDLDLDVEEEDEEPLQDGRIDVGELTAQYLSLALDPYPKAPGVEFDPHIEHVEGEADAVAEEGDEGSRPSPFAALAKLRRPS